MTKQAYPVGPNAYFGPYKTIALLQADHPAVDNVGRFAFVGDDANPATNTSRATWVVCIVAQGAWKTVTVT